MLLCAGVIAPAPCLKIENVWFCEVLGGSLGVCGPGRRQDGQPELLKLIRLAVKENVIRRKYHEDFYGKSRYNR